MTTTNLQLPCRCEIEVDFPKGQRGVSCPRHERTFIVAAVIPTEVEHKVTKEIPYVLPKKDG